MNPKIYLSIALVTLACLAPALKPEATSAVLAVLACVVLGDRIAETWNRPS